MTPHSAKFPALLLTTVISRRAAEVGLYRALKIQTEYPLLGYDVNANHEIALTWQPHIEILTENGIFSLRRRNRASKGFNEMPPSFIEFGGGEPQCNIDAISSDMSRHEASKLPNTHCHRHDTEIGCQIDRA